MLQQQQRVLRECEQDGGIAADVQADSELNDGRQREDGFQAQ
jgi:hypothetical protein